MYMLGAQHISGFCFTMFSRVIIINASIWGNKWVISRANIKQHQTLW